MFEYQYEQVAPYVITKQVIDDGDYVYWKKPDGKLISDFNMCVQQWIWFLNQNAKEHYRGY